MGQEANKEKRIEQFNNDPQLKEYREELSKIELDSNLMGYRNDIGGITLYYEEPIQRQINDLEAKIDAYVISHYPDLLDYHP